MVRQFRILIFVLLTLFVTVCLCVAAPSQPTVSGTVSDGESVTLSGTSFGTGSTIISWDNFDNHTTGVDLSGGTLSPTVGPNWTTFKISPATDPVEISTTRSHSGTKSVYILWDDDTINSFGWVNRGPYSELYITWWSYQYLSGANIEDCNRKWFYLYGNSSQMPQGMPLIPAGATAWGYYNNVSTTQAGTSAYSGTNNISNDGVYGTGNTITWAATNSTWNRWEYYQKLNTDYNCTIGSNCDGVIRYWVDAVKRYDRTDYKHRFVDGQWVDFRLGHMWQGSGTRQAWIDDVFIATTQARIEIGDNSSFDSCTHREIQRHTSWADGSIDVTINQGSFADGATAYVFVIDSTGAASTGRQIIFGTGSSPTGSLRPGVSASGVTFR